MNEGKWLVYHQDGSDRDSQTAYLMREGELLVTTEDESLGLKLWDDGRSIHQTWPQHLRVVE